MKLIRHVNPRHGAFAMIALVLSGAALAAPDVTLTHVHGLAYSADGKRIFVPSHHGLAVYSDGAWSKAPGPAHDYMGFTATQNRFYSSGHPAPGSGLTNPFGLILSTDGGRTWQNRGLQGETDFHVLGASYGTNAVYAHTPAPNSRMKTPGLYYTLNDGFSWKRAQAQGLEGIPNAVAVHPTKPAVMAVATKQGIFLSRNHGDRFNRIAPGQGLAAFFELDGEHLLFSRYDDKPHLVRHALQSGTKTEVALPPLTRDAVSHIAQNPADKDRFAIATFERSVFLSPDGGKSWKPIARNGRGN